MWEGTLNGSGRAENISYKIQIICNPSTSRASIFVISWHLNSFYLQTLPLFDFGVVLVNNSNPKRQETTAGACKRPNPAFLGKLSSLYERTNANWKGPLLLLLLQQSLHNFTAPFTTHQTDPGFWLLL